MSEKLRISRDLPVPEYKSNCRQSEREWQQVNRMEIGSLQNSGSNFWRDLIFLIVLKFLTGS